MATAVIVDAIRTPLGKRNGKLKDWHPVDLAAEVLSALVERTGIDPGIVDDVVMGCVMQVGEQGVNIGRNAVLAAGWPEEVPGTTIDRQCGSSQQAAHFGAQGVIAGAYDVVVAAGVPITNVVGKNITRAREEIAAAGLTVGDVRRRYDPDHSPNIVLAQTPAAGEQAAPGSAVALVANQGI